MADVLIFDCYVIPFSQSIFVLQFYVGDMPGTDAT